LDRFPEAGLATPPKASRCRFLKLTAVLTAATLGATTTAHSQPPPSLSAGEIIERALRRSEGQNERLMGRVLTTEMFEVTEKLDSSGSVKSRQEDLFLTTLYDTHPFFEKVRVDGRKLTAKEQSAEKRRMEKFLRELEREKGKDTFTNPKGNRVDFNRDLIGRYRTKLAGRESIHGREAFVIEFEPKDGKLPANRRIDYALNKSNGKLWVDVEDYGVARVEFHLVEPVKLWAGLLGKVTQLDGSIETVRHDEGFWLPRELKLYFNGRILFLSFHERSTSTWRHWVPGPQAPNRSQGAGDPARACCHALRLMRPRPGPATIGSTAQRINSSTSFTSHKPRKFLHPIPTTTYGAGTTANPRKLATPCYSPTKGRYGRFTVPTRPQTAQLLPPPGESPPTSRTWAGRW
jgi:hypothetical protein